MPAHVHAFGEAQRDKIGNVIFPAAVVAGEARQQTARRGQRKEIDARIHFVRVFERAVEGGIEVPGLHDGAHPALAAHHAAVGGGVFEFEAQKGRVRAFCGVEKVIEHLGGDEGRVAVHHEHAAVAVKLGHGGHEGVAGAELLFLPDAGGGNAQPLGRAGGLGGNHVGLVAHQSENAVHAGHGRQRGRDQRKHGFAKKRLEHLGPGGGHARALAGRENEGVDIHVSLHGENGPRRTRQRREP